jgi:hypothetical protein
VNVIKFRTKLALGGVFVNARGVRHGWKRRKRLCAKVKGRLLQQNTSHSQRCVGRLLCVRARKTKEKNPSKGFQHGCMWGFF